MNKNDNLIYNKDIISLFTNTFDNITINNNVYNTYNWDNMKKYFNKLIELLVNFDLNKQNKGEYIKYYNFTKISFIYYINYLEYIDHKDALNNDIDTFNNEFKYNLKIIHNIHLSCKYPLKLLNILHPFFKNAKSYYNRDNETYLNICKTNKKYESICLQITNLCIQEKIINLITFNHNMVKNLDYNNYSEFYYKNVIDRKHYFNNNFIDFTTFVDNIPKYKKILSIDVNENDVNDNDVNENDVNKRYDKGSVKHVRISEIINFVLKFFPYLLCTKIDKNMYVISHIKNGGKIIIEKSTETINIIFQYNLNLFYLNNPELKDITFFKNTNNFIKIKYQNNVITDLTTLLNTFYFITRSCKYIDHCANSIDEILNIEQYNYCFYDTFFYFLSFIQKNIGENTYYKKFVIDVIKYYYLYSYYDYHFYNDIELVTELNKNKSKNMDENKKIFDKFCYNVKKLFKIPNELLSYPPFFKIDNSTDNIFLYSYDYINYIKFYDILYSISTVFKFNTKNIYDIINKLLSYTTNKEDEGKEGEGKEGEGKEDEEDKEDREDEEDEEDEEDKEDREDREDEEDEEDREDEEDEEDDSWKKGDGSYGISTDWSDDEDEGGCGDEDGDEGGCGDEDGDEGGCGDEDGDEDGDEGGYGDGKGDKNNKFIELSDDSSEDHMLITEYN